MRLATIDACDGYFPHEAIDFAGKAAAGIGGEVHRVTILRAIVVAEASVLKHLEF